MTPNENLYVNTAQNDTIPVMNIHKHQPLEFIFINSLPWTDPSSAIINEKSILVMKTPNAGMQAPYTIDPRIPERLFILGLL
jgi:hypothetical protein